MPPIPNVNNYISDGALGLIADPSDLDQLSMGACSAGTTNTLYGFSNLDDLRSTFGTGPLVEAMALKLAEPGHGTVYGCRVNGGTAGSNTSVTLAGTGPNPGITVSGVPLDSYAFQGKITKGGAVGTAEFQYSLDGGDTWSTTIVSAASYPIANTGLTLAFTAGTYVVGDVYSFTSTAPYYTTTDLTNAFNGVLADPREWGLVHVVGTPTTAAATATVFSALDTLMANAAANFRYSRAIMEAADDTDANLISAFASLSSTNGRTHVAAGFAETLSLITGRIMKRPAAWTITARAGATPISQDLAWVGRGKLNAISSLLRDENATPGLDAARFMTLRTITGAQGFYVTNPKSMAALTSDFQYLQYGRVMDVLCRTVRNGALKYLSQSLRVNDTTGTIYELDARTIEQDLTGLANAALAAPGHASKIVVQVNRTDNILSTRILRISARCVPLAYGKQIDITLGFTNPALSIAA